MGRSIVVRFGIFAVESRLFQFCWWEKWSCERIVMGDCRSLLIMSHSLREFLLTLLALTLELILLTCIRLIPVSASFAGRNDSQCRTTAAGGSWRTAVHVCQLVIEECHHSTRTVHWYQKAVNDWARFWMNACVQCSPATRQTCKSCHTVECAEFRVYV